MLFTLEDFFCQLASSGVGLAPAVQKLSGETWGNLNELKKRSVLAPGWVCEGALVSSFPLSSNVSI